MTTNAYAPMNCDDFTERSMAYMEGDVDAATRAAMDAHLAACAACSALVADMRSIASAAGRLPELTPSRDLWEGIAARIEAPVIALADRSIARRGRAPAWWRTAAAAVVLMALTSSVTYYATRRTVDTTAPAPIGSVATATPRVDTSAPSASAEPSTESAIPSAPSSSGAVLTPAAARSTRAPSAAKTLDGASATYDQEIKRLRALIAQRRPQMDTATANVIEKNLTIIDEAIAQCRAALARDPNSRFLLENLNSALDNKVQLLRTAAMLPART